jgi:YHS domain-containing protein
MARLLAYLFDLILIMVVGWMMRRIFQALSGHPQASPRRHHEAPRTTTGPALRGETARDPVCGMFVSTELSHRLQRGGETLHFCSRECLKRFESEASHS